MPINIEHDARVVQIAEKIGRLLYEEWIRFDLFVRIESFYLEKKKQPTYFSNYFLFCIMMFLL